MVDLVTQLREAVEKKYSRESLETMLVWVADEIERLRAAQQPSSPETDDQYRKKPVVIRAWRLGSEETRPEWAKWTFGNGHDYAEVQTLEGTMRGNRGDWIIQGVKGELYFCKPDIFAATYEPASTPAQCAPMRAALKAFIKAYGSQDSFTEGLDKAKALAVSALALSQKVK